LLSSGTFALVGLLPDEQFDGRGWRVPFLSAFMLLAVGLYLRARVEEPIGAPLSPEAPWRNRKAKYVEWLASPDAFALTAR
jgi:hypothetical protein